uniref:MGAT4 conserved region domain-containing protein n=1 Tax=Aotus nancymaae TaxID=37293 RepID=A0A2K5F2Z2_AOTNA
NQLINCRNHILEFKENMLHLRNKTEKNSQEMMKVWNRMKYEITKRENMSGNLGKLFRSEDLTHFVCFFLMFYKDKPIDWLLDDIFQVKLCDTGEDLKNCLKRKKQIRIQYKPSLFQHVGIHSSLSGKKQYEKKI